jgi:hypothetical protein
MSNHQPFIGPGSRREVREVRQAMRIPPNFMIPAYSTLLSGLLAFREKVNPILGADPDWSFRVNIVWALLLGAAMWQSSAWANLMWWKIKKVRFDQVKVAFAAAGGFDIGYWLPMAVVLTLLGIYWITYDPSSDPLEVLRSPWRFLIVAKIASDVAVGFVSHMVFRANRFLRGDANTDSGGLG